MSLLKALDSSNVAQHLKVNASGALECSVNEIELTATNINLAVDGLEALQTTTNTKLNGGLPSSLSSDNLKVSLKETITVPISGSVTATVSGVSTEAKQDSIISTLGDTNSKIDAMRGSNSITDLATKLNAGLPSALSSDNLKVSIQEGQITGFSTSSLQTSANNTLSSIDGKIVLPAALDSGKLKVVDSAVVDVGNKIDAMRDTDTLTTLKGVLDNIDSDTNDIKTSIQSLDNAVDGNYLNVNQNVAGADVAVNSGNKGVTVPRVCIATDDIPIALVNTKLQAGNDLLATIDADTNDIKTAIQSLDNAVDGNYLNVNQNVAGADVAVDSGNKGTTVPRVCIATDDIPIALVNTKLQAGNDLLATIDSDTNDIKTATELIGSAIGTDGSAGPAKCISIGATASLGGALQEVACDGDGHLQIDILSSALPSGAATDLPLQTVATKTLLATSAEIKELLSGATVNQATLSAELDTEHYEKIRVFGETSASVGSDIKIFGSNVSGGTYYYLNNGDLMATSLTVSGVGTVHYIGGSFENIPRYIKIFNNSGSTNHTFTKLYMVGSGGRVAV